MTLQRVGMIGKAPSSLICWRVFSLSWALSAVTANGDRGVFSISSTAWLSWTCPPVTARAQRPTFGVDDGVDFRGSTASADADRLIFLPPFAPLAARCAFTTVLSIRYRLSRDLAASRWNTPFRMPRRVQRLSWNLRLASGCSSSLQPKCMVGVMYGPQRLGTLIRRWLSSSPLTRCWRFAKTLD